MALPEQTSLAVQNLIKCCDAKKFPKSKCYHTEYQQHL